jgi:hypothetical protein
VEQHVKNATQRAKIERLQDENERLRATMRSAGESLSRVDEALARAQRTAELIASI